MVGRSVRADQPGIRERFTASDRGIHFPSGDGSGGDIQQQRVSVGIRSGPRQRIAAKDCLAGPGGCHTGHIITGHHGDKALASGVLSVVAGSTDVSAVTHSNECNSTESGLLHAQFQCCIAGHLPQRMVSVHDCPGRPVTFNLRNCRWAVTAALQTIQISSQ